jgi:hypothetical protein
MSIYYSPINVPRQITRTGKLDIQRIKELIEKDGRVLVHWEKFLKMSPTKYAYQDVKRDCMNELFCNYFCRFRDPQMGDSFRVRWSISGDQITLSVNTKYPNAAELLNQACEIFDKEKQD